MIPEYFAIIGAVIASLGGLYYLFETIMGRTKPNRVTWLLWGLFPMIIFIAQRVQGVNSLSWATFTAGAGPLLVFTASIFNKKAYWKTELKDYILMIAALAGLFLWGITKEPNLAIFFSLTADLLAGVPTLIKAWKHPESESWPAFGISTVGFTLTFLSVSTYNFENLAFVTYLVLINAVITLLALRKRSDSPVRPAISVDRRRD